VRKRIIQGKIAEVMIMAEWVHCPVCGNKTRLQIRADTELKNFPLYCPKCKQESLIDAKDLQVTVIKRLEAKTQS
jgi:Zn finger protein HypA/HybF involved in hydrogenase expression